MYGTARTVSVSAGMLIGAGLAMASQCAYYTMVHGAGLSVCVQTYPGAGLCRPLDRCRSVQVHRCRPETYPGAGLVLRPIPVQTLCRPVPVQAFPGARFSCPPCSAVHVHHDTPHSSGARVTQQVLVHCSTSPAFFLRGKERRGGPSGAAPGPVGTVPSPPKEAPPSAAQRGATARRPLKPVKQVG